MPETQQWFGRYRADFHWPDLNLVVEADSGRFHRTAAQQTRDRKKDQALLAQGLTVVRFTHAQIRYEPASVAETLYALLIARRSSSARTKRSRSPSSTR